MTEHDGEMVDPVDGIDDDLVDGVDGVDDDLVRALRAPGSAAELAREQEYVGAYRDAGPPPAPVPLRRRSLRRLGTGGTAVAVVVALSGGVAAAYTGHLPDPVQQLAHDVIGVPAPLREAPAAAPDDPGVGDDTTAPEDPAPSEAPASPAPAEPSPAAADPDPTTPGPTGGPGSSSSAAPSPSGSPAAGPSASPSGNAGAPAGDSPAPVRAAAVRIRGGAHLTAYGSSVRLSGRVTTASGAPVTGRRAQLQARRADGWVTVAEATTDRSGQVGADSAAVTGRALYRWRVRGAASRGWQLRVRATLSATADVAPQQTTVTATAVGGTAGDRVLLVTRVQGEARVVARTTLAGDGRASFTVRTPTRRRTFAVVLVKTPDHTAARASVTVAPPTGRPTDLSEDPEAAAP